MSELSRNLSRLYRSGLERQRHALSYPIARRLDSVDKEFSYQTILPAWQGQNLTQLLEKITAAGPAAILDVGCGVGNFLIDVRRQFGPAVVCHGISAFPYHNPAITDNFGIEIETGDIQTLRRPNAYDLITAVHSLQYTQNPLRALKRIYAALKPGGVALLSPIAILTEQPGDEANLLAYLEGQYGMVLNSAGFTDRVHGWTVAFAKTKDRLILPVQLSGFHEHDRDYLGITQVEYRFR